LRIETKRHSGAHSMRKELHSKRQTKSIAVNKKKVAAVDVLMTESALLFFRMKVAAAEMIGKGAGSAGRRSILRELANSGPQTVPQMARARPVARQHFQKIVNTLNLDGLVELIPNPAHERSKLVRLTSEGRLFVESLSRREAKLIANLAADISMRDVRTATKVLRELRDKFAGREWKRLLERVP
jgi:DNA-binding MarR family transcriptional regulator